MSSDLFLHNWVDRVVLRTAWLVDLTQSTEDGLAEQRLALLTDKPKRQIEVSWLAWDRTLAVRMLMFLLKSSDQEQKIPVYQDQAITTATSSGTTIFCPTAYRRFTVGGQVVIYERDGEGRASNPQFRTVTAVGASSLTISEALTGSYPALSEVCPVMVCRKVLDARLTCHTDGVAEIKATFDEVLGEGSIDPSNAEEADQVLVLRPDWAEAVEIGFVRPGEVVPTGRDEAVEVRGDRPLKTFNFTVTEFTREDFWDMLQTFDGCRGRLVPLWLVNPLVAFVPLDLSANHVDVEIPDGATLADFQDYVSHVSLRDLDGVVEIKTVTGITEEAGPVWRVAFTENTALTMDDLDEVTTAHYVRFAEDELTEEWITDEAWQATLSFVEVPPGEDTAYGTDGTFADCGVS